jgi:hypothetical protein
MGGFILWHHIFWYWPNRGRDGDPGGLERFPGHPWQCGPEVVPVLPLAHFDFHQGGKVPADCRRSLPPARQSIGLLVLVVLLKGLDESHPLIMTSLPNASAVA